MSGRPLALLLSILTCVSTHAHAGSPPRRASEAGPSGYQHRSLVARPTTFEPNVGQTDGSVRFLSRSRGYTAFLTDGGATLSLGGGRGESRAALRMAFENGRPDARPSAERELAGRVNYLVGPDSARWRRDVPTYAAVRYADVYPGVDAVFSGAGDHLEYDFVVAPGGDVSQIRLRFEGQRSIAVGEDGDVRIDVGTGSLRQLRPVAFQDGAGKERVSAKCVVDPDGIVRFEVGAFDPTRPLVIDPVLVHSSYLSGSGIENATAIAADGSGASYVTGDTSSATFPTTVGAYDPEFNGNVDVFVTKVDPSGSSLVYSTYVGGFSTTQGGTAIEVDATGAAYVAGSTAELPSSSFDFPLTDGAYDTTYNGQNDVFVFKLDPTGSSLVYSTLVGTAASDVAQDLGLDSAGEVVVVGLSNSPSYPVTPGAFDTTPNGDHDIFVTKLDATGASLVYSSFVTGAVNTDTHKIAVDADGAAYVTGFANADLPTTPDAYIPTASSGGYLCKFAPDGASLGFATYTGSTTARSIAVDPSGAVCLVGATDDPDYPVTPGAYDTTPNGGLDAYVTKFNTGGTALVYSTFLGGSDDDEAVGIAVAPSGFVYVVGRTFSSTFPVTPDGFDTTFGGGFEPNDYDGFVAVVDPRGTELPYASFVGGNRGDDVAAVAVDPRSGIHLAGSTSSTDFPPQGFGVDDLSKVFVVKLLGIAGDSPGIYTGEPAAWFLKNANAPGTAESVFTYGPPASGWIPLCGDWDGDGADTPGLYDSASGAFFLKNANAPGDADSVFTFGPGGDDVVPVVGDFDGDDTDTIGIYSRSTGAFFLKNTNAGGTADVVFTFGPGGPTLVPLTGDWDGDGNSTIGLYDPDTGAFFLKNTNDAGNADLVFTFGGGGATPLAGDWDGTGDDTIGLYVPATGAWFLRNSNDSGPAHVVFSYGPAGAVPLVGNWDGR